MNNQPYPPWYVTLAPSLPALIVTIGVLACVTVLIATGRLTGDLLVTLASSVFVGALTLWAGSPMQASRIQPPTNVTQINQPDDGAQPPPATRRIPAGRG